MRERVALLGGRFEIQSHPRNGSGSGPGNGKASFVRGKKSKGTRISITLPVAKEPPSFDLIEPIATKPIGSKSARRVKAVGA